MRKKLKSLCKAKTPLIRQNRNLQNGKNPMSNPISNRRVREEMWRGVEMGWRLGGGKWRMGRAGRENGHCGEHV